MRHVDVVQGTSEWLAAKAGVVSASNFHRVLSPKEMKPSKQMGPYAHELIAEQLLGRPLDDATTAWMQRGTLLEPDARDYYSMQRDVDIEEVGFLVRDDGRVGCSPDGLVSEDGGVEVKCPNAQTHIGYLLGDAREKYRCQIQGCMWIAEREWWDLVSYNPELPSLIVRFERDDAFIAKLAEGVEMLLAMVDASKAQLVAQGYLPELASVA